MIERLGQFIQNQKLSVRAFEQSIAASDGMIRRALNNKTDIQSKWLSVIADNYPDLNIEWLITGRGEMLRTEPVVPVAPGSPVLRNTSGLPEISGGPILSAGSELVHIPLVDIDVAAGSGCENPDYIEEVECISLPTSMIRNGKKYLCVRIKGHSMAPSILDGGFVVIRLLERSEWSEIQDNYVYVVSDIEGKAYVKRLKNRLAQFGFIVCMSDNIEKLNYPNFNIYEEELNTIWYVEWYFTAKVPNIQESFYRKQNEFEDRLDQLAAQVQRVQKVLNSKN